MHKKIVEGGSSIAGWSMASKGRRCLRLWALSRPVADEDEPSLGDHPEDWMIDTGSGLNPSMSPPLVRGIVVHLAAGHFFLHRMPTLPDRESYASWRYALMYGVGLAIGRSEHEAHQGGLWADGVGLDVQAEVTAAHWPDGKLVTHQVAKWVQSRLDFASSVTVEAIERPLELWLDPDAQDPNHDNPMIRYGVSAIPHDAERRRAAYRLLRSPSWREGLKRIKEAGPPYLFTTRLDMQTSETSMLTGRRKVLITDFKSGMRIGRAKHEGYRNTGQIIGLDVWGRTQAHAEGATFDGVLLDYIPFTGSPWKAMADVAEGHRTAFAAMITDHWERLCSFYDKPLHRWTPALEEQTCRSIYSDPCDLYRVCRGVRHKI